MQTERPDKFLIDDKQVKDVLKDFENETEKDMGLDRISGGFAVADIFNYDEDYFDIELKYGIQSDCENNVTTEQYKMDRLTLKIEDC